MRKKFEIASILLIGAMLALLFVSCATTENVPTQKVCKITLVDCLNPGKPEEVTAYAGDEYAVPSKSREGFKLRSVESLQGRSYQPEEKFTVSADTVLIYRWAKTHTLTLVNLKDEPQSRTMYDGDTFTVPPAFDKDGYNLVSITDASGKPYWIGNQVVIHSDLLLTYKWEKMNPERDWNKEDIGKVSAALAQNCLNSPAISRFEAKAVEGTHEQNTAVPSVPVIEVRIFNGVSEDESKVLKQALEAEILASGKAAIAPTEKAEGKTPGTPDFVLKGWVYETVKPFGDIEEVKTYHVVAQLSTPEKDFIVWEDTDSQISKKYLKLAK